MSDTAHAPATVRARSTTVEALLERVAGGDREAFAELYDQLAPVVYGIARRVLVNPSMAEEVTQDVLLAVWTNAASFDPARGSARAWILMQAHRRAVDAVRSEQAARNRAERVAAATLERPFDEVADVVVDRMVEGSRARELTRALDALTPLQRAAIELAYFKGFTYAHVAQVLDIPLGTAKTRIRDGMRRLTQSVECPRWDSNPD